MFSEDTLDTRSQQFNVTERLCLKFQISTNVQLQKPTTATLMQYATIPWDRTPVHAKLDTLEMDGLAKVNALSSFASQVNRVRVEKLGNQKFFSSSLTRVSNVLTISQIDCYDAILCF